MVGLIVVVVLVLVVVPLRVFHFPELSHWLSLPLACAIFHGCQVLACALEVLSFEGLHGGPATVLRHHWLSVFCVALLLLFVTLFSGIDGAGASLGMVHR